MRPLQILIALFFGGLVLYPEFQSIKEYSVFSAFIESLPFWGLCLLIVILLAIQIKQYSEKKKITFILPLLICITSLAITLGHQKMIENLDNSPTNFKAITYDIGNDGGFIFDFKKDGHLKAEKRDHWLDTYYWGNYSQNQDTINLYIPLNFKLGRKALLTLDSLHFINDTVKFSVFRR